MGSSPTPAASNIDSKVAKEDAICQQDSLSVKGSANTGITVIGDMLAAIVVYAQLIVNFVVVLETISVIWREKKNCCVLLLRSIRIYIEEEKIIE